MAMLNNQRVYGIAVDSWVAQFSLEFAQDAWGEIERSYVL